MSKVFWHPEAREELEQLDRSRRKIILDVVTRFEEKGASIGNFSLIEQEYVETDYYRLKAKQDSPSVNHRLIISDYRNKWVVYGLKHRDTAYSEETFLDLEERTY